MAAANGVAIEVCGRDEHMSGHSLRFARLWQPDMLFAASPIVPRKCASNCQRLIVSSKSRARCPFKESSRQAPLPGPRPTCRLSVGCVTPNRTLRLRDPAILPQQCPTKERPCLNFQSKADSFPTPIIFKYTPRVIRPNSVLIRTAFISFASTPTLVRQIDMTQLENRKREPSQKHPVRWKKAIPMTSSSHWLLGSRDGSRPFSLRTFASRYDAVSGSWERTARRFSTGGRRRYQSRFWTSQVATMSYASWATGAMP